MLRHAVGDRHPKCVGMRARQLGQTSRVGDVPFRGGVPHHGHLYLPPRWLPSFTAGILIIRNKAHPIRYGTSKEKAMATSTTDTKAVKAITVPAEIADTVKKAGTLPVKSYES